jgi:hypothetical protein
MTVQPLSSYVVVGVTTCLSIPAAIVTAFIVDPGSNVHDTARSCSDTGSAAATREGSNVGQDASARIAPSRGSRTMIDPLGAFSFSIARRSASSAAVCTTRSIVRTRSGAVLRRHRGPKAERELAVFRIAFDHEPAGYTAEHLVVRALDAVLANAVVVDEAENVSGQGIVRIEPLRLRLESQPGDREGLDRPCDRLGQSSLQVEPLGALSPARRGSWPQESRGPARASLPPQRDLGSASVSRTASADRPSSRGPDRSDRGSHRAAPR